MYSAFIKYACLIASTIMLVAAGAGLANHGLKQGFVISFLLGLGCLHLYAVQCRAQGAQPITKLMIGHSYVVEAAMPDLQTDRGPAIYRLVVTWHVDMGHYESRLAHLNSESFRKRPEVGQRLLVSTGDFGQPHYILYSE